MATTGRWFATGDIDVLNVITTMSGTTVNALHGIPVIGPGAEFVNGAWNILFWNYPYLDNAWGAAFKVCFLYPISYGVLYGFVELASGVWQGLATQIKNLM